MIRTALILLLISTILCSIDIRLFNSEINKLNSKEIIKNDDKEKIHTYRLLKILSFMIIIINIVIALAAYAIKTIQSPEFIELLNKYSNG